MRLLVSVATVDDARAAVEGGADIVDAKDPSAGALGAVTVARLREIRDAVAGARPLTAALGDAADEAATERRAREYADAGAALVKIGLLGTTCVDRATRLVSAAVRGLSTTTSGVVVVAYADADANTTLRPDDVIDVAARSGARGVLIDTIDKNGPGLLGVMSPGNLIQWVAAGHAAGLLVAAAGKLLAGDLRVIDDVGADVAGVRGAAAVGGRAGRVSVDLVRTLAGYTARVIPRSDAATGNAAAPPGYRSQSSDTPYDVDRLLIDLWASMSPAEKAHRVASAFRGVEQLSEAGVRLRHPAAAESEVRLRVAALRLGRRLMIDAYGLGPRARRRVGVPPELNNPVELAALVASILDRLGLRYVVGGAVASTLLGEPRATLDLDVLIEVVPASLLALADELEAADFYVPRGAASAAVEPPRSFKAVHRPSAIKVDFFVAGRTALDHDELGRRRAVTFAGVSGGTIYVAAVEDLVAQKLLWYRDGGETSDRQWRDVLGLLKVQSTHIDRTLLSECAVRLGVDDLLTQALRETART